MRKIITAAVIACLMVAGLMIINHRTRTDAGQNPDRSITGQPGDIGPNGTIPSQTQPARQPTSAEPTQAGPPSTTAAPATSSPTVQQPARTPGPDTAPTLPYSEQFTDQELRATFNESLAGKTRPPARLEHQATTVAWKHLKPDINAAHLWTKIRLRDTAAVCDGRHPNRTDPDLVTVITIWSGQTTDDRTEIHRSETQVAHSGNIWTVVHD